MKKRIWVLGGDAGGHPTSGPSPSSPFFGSLGTDRPRSEDTEAQRGVQTAPEDGVRPPVKTIWSDPVDAVNAFFGKD